MTASHPLTARSRVDLLAAVPYLLGFRPTDSIVVLALRGTRVIFQARVDAPVPAEVDELIRYLAAIVVRQDPTSAVVVGYGPEHPTEVVLAGLARALGAVGVPVADALRVHDGRYWSLTCGDDSCGDDSCGDESGAREGVAYDTATSAFAAAAAVTGRAPLPDRAALVATLAPVPGPGLEPELARAEERLAALAIGGARRRRTAARAAVRDGLERYAARGRLDDDEVAWLATLIDDRRARDDAWQRMVAVPPRDEHTALWRDVVRRVPDRYVPAPATLLALAHWRAGDGAAASVAVDWALTVDPGYPLAELVRQALVAAIPPTMMDERVPRRRRRRPARLPRPVAGEIRSA